MDRTERFYKIERLLKTRRAVSYGTFLEELGVSLSTFKRDIQYMRDRLNAPIVWDRGSKGYRFTDPFDGPVYELPGMWFSSSELYALLAAHKCLSEIDPGILSSHVAPIQSRIAGLLENSGHPPSEIMRRVRLLPMTRRTVEPRFFTQIAGALFGRWRIEIEAYSRVRDELNTRTVSPQRLVHYRDNWYLDAWCHWRGALRSFSVDAVRRVSPIDSHALEIMDADLDAHFAASYGIFAGKVKERAVLHFSPMRARWVEYEQWHPEQVCEHLDNGGCRLIIPYSDAREILMDILRHGAGVVVEAPNSLRELVATEIERMAANYGPSSF
ncbi:MAG: WYL domain-containing protein [Nitrospiraceae bacterium]|nr:WYL domain-containing protein [Nitrospiraceae bacterium]